MTHKVTTLSVSGDSKPRVA